MSILGLSFKAVRELFNMLVFLGFISPPTVEVISVKLFVVCITIAITSASDSEKFVHSVIDTHSQLKASLY